jgi:AcrR family transcriptional regulator
MTGRRRRVVDAGEAGPVPSLPVLAEPPVLRADAARNREKLLEAAARLFDQHGVDAVPLDDVVAAAGVGKGTLYRIFGDKSGLGAALLDERERELQRRILTGEPPVGPGATPAERMAAFVHAYVRYVAAHLELVRMSQTSRPDARFDTGSHKFWRAHLRHLLEQAGAPNPGFAADVLLAAMTAEQIGHWMRDEGSLVEHVAGGLASVAADLMRSYHP